MNQNYGQLFKMLSDDTRLQILRLLSQGHTCGCTLIERLSITQPTLSYHLQELTNCGILTSYKEGVWKKHRINPDTIDELISFLSSLKEQAKESHL